MMFEIRDDNQPKKKKNSKNQVYSLKKNNMAPNKLAGHF